MKLFWYMCSMLTILLILINNPSGNGFSSSFDQGKIINFRTSQVNLQKIISYNVFAFFIFTIISLVTLK
uniref:Probable protein-export membrane protein SecG n=1 Tax=Cliftonaea pectinata TaxID=2007206 RepID=A0A1Z1MQZ0_9FLOR|nr:preprotein-translocase subunit g [Cliftonaea pectinata]ARW68154.1 preprotein-translocase subunit g [Cliftonaea pectinata]